VVVGSAGYPHPSILFRCSSVGCPRPWGHCLDVLSAWLGLRVYLKKLRKQEFGGGPEMQIEPSHADLDVTGQRRFHDLCVLARDVSRASCQRSCQSPVQLAGVEQ
jgi:hypothetical protein